VQGSSGPQGPAGWSPKTYALNDTGPGQGIVFVVTPDGLHGIEAATSDQSTNVGWDNGANVLTNAGWNGLNGGRNTERIISSQGAGSYAASVCANYAGGNYGDWYLPTIYELSLMRDYPGIALLTYSSLYWSSTETDIASVWGIWPIGYPGTNGLPGLGIGNDMFGKNVNQYVAMHVRCVRAF
jgi:hypothetical protein